jgi:drug/metabolite transporter (DMT)-like permease
VNQGAHALNRTALTLLAAAATGIQVGAAITATRFAVDMIGPASLAFLRYAIGTACLAPVLLSGRVRFARGDILPIALLGIGQFGVLIALLNFGLKSVPAARAALIFASFPMLTLLFAALIGQERVTGAKTAGVALTILGVGFALGDKTLSSGQSWIGEAAVLASALVGAICSVLYRPYLKRYPTLPVSAFAMLAAVLALAVPAALDDLFTAVPRLTPSGWAAVVFIGLSSGGGYVLWLWALANTDATRVTVFLSLSPITAAVLGVALLGEPVTGTMIAGCGCVAAGLWIANREPRAD